MAEYELTDDRTGMTVTVDADGELTEQKVRATLGEARKRAFTSLADKSYRLDEETKLPLDKDRANEKLQKFAAYSMGVKPNEVDIDSGMGMKGRAILRLLPDDSSRIESLEKKYGEENVNMLNVGGKPKMFYRDPKTKKMTMVDEMGASLADFTADLAGVAAPIAGSVVGGLKGAAVGSAVPGVGTIVGGALGAAAGYFGAGVTQDVAAEIATGQDLELGKKIKKRGFESLVGIPIDLVTGGMGRVIAPMIAKRVGLKAVDDLIKSTDELNQSYAANLKLTAAQASTPESSIKQGQRAALDPRGREARWYDRQRDKLLEIDRTIKDGVSSDVPVEQVMADMGEKHLTRLEQYRRSIEQLDELSVAEKAAGKKQTQRAIAQEKDKLKKQRDLEHQARVDRYSKSFNKMRKSVDKLESVRGARIRKQVEEKYKQSVDNNNNLYEEAYRLTDTPQANTPVSDVKRVVDRIDENQLIPDSAELRALQNLKRRIVENPNDLTFRELDAFVREFGDRVNFKKKHGLKYSEINLRNVNMELQKLWDTAVGAPKSLGARGAGESARKAHMAARKDFRQNILPYTDGEPSKILQQRAGGMAGSTLADEKVLTESLSDSAAVKNALKAGADRGELKQAYLNEVLQRAEGGKPIAFSRSILDALYSTTPGRAGNIQRQLNDLNKMLRESKIKPEKVTRDDLIDFIETYESKGAVAAKKALRDKVAVQEQLDEASKNVLMKVIKGEQPAPEDIHTFIDDIAKLRPSQIKDLMARLPEPEQKSLKRAGIDWFLEKSGRSTDRAQRSSAQTQGIALWEPDAMEALLRDPKSRAKLDELMGKDIVDDYARANKVLAAGSSIRETGEGTGTRVVMTTGMSGVPMPLVVSPGLPRWLGRKLLGIINTNPVGQMMLRRWLREPNQESTEQAFKRIFFSGIGTRAGMAAAADEAGKDPQFDAWFQESLAGLDEAQRDASAGAE